MIEWYAKVSPEEKSNENFWNKKISWILVSLSLDLSSDVYPKLKWNNWSYMETLIRKGWFMIMYNTILKIYSQKFFTSITYKKKMTFLCGWSSASNRWENVILVNFDEPTRCNFSRASRPHTYDLITSLYTTSYEDNTEEEGICSQCMIPCQLQSESSVRRSIQVDDFDHRTRPENYRRRKWWILEFQSPNWLGK